MTSFDGGVKISSGQCTRQFPLAAQLLRDSILFAFHFMGTVICISGFPPSTGPAAKGPSAWIAIEGQRAQGFLQIGTCRNPQETVCKDEEKKCIYNRSQRPCGCCPGDTVGLDKPVQAGSVEWDLDQVKFGWDLWPARCLDECERKRFDSEGECPH